MGHPRKARTQRRATAHTCRHGPRLTTGNKGLVAKLRMGWEPLAPTPFAIYVVCSRISQLWPFNSACLSTLSSVASCLSALPFTLFRSANFRPTTPRQTRFIRHSSRPSSCFASSVKPTALYPRPVSCPHIDPTFIVLSADLASIDPAIVRRTSHPPQRHTHPLTSRRQPDTRIATPDPQHHAHPQPPICPPTPRSSFAFDLRQPCACHVPPSARRSHSFAPVRLTCRICQFSRPFTASTGALASHHPPTTHSSFSPPSFKGTQ